ncbi:MAG: efflux RND transporter periplasmic adaptor subunit [Vulcanimicrobiota bacterium]
MNNRYFLVILISLLVNTGCGQKLPTVRVASPVRADIKVDFLATGTTEAREVAVPIQNHGYLRELLIEKDQLVKKGQALAVIEDQGGQEELEFLLRDLNIMRSNRDELATQLELKRAQMALNTRTRQAQGELARAQYQEKIAEVSEQKVQVAEATVDETEASLRQARREHERMQELFEEDIASQAQVERAQMEEEIALARRTRAIKELEDLKNGLTREARERAKAELSASRAALPDGTANEIELSLMQKQLDTNILELLRKEAEVERQRKRLARSTIRAPIDGRVLELTAEVDELLGGGNLVVLVDDKNVWVEADVSEQDSTYVEVGQPVQVHLPSLDGQRFPGKIESVGAALRTPRDVIGNARFLGIKVVFDEEIKGIRPGLEADVEGSRLLAENALTVPHQAVFREGEQNFVVVLEGNRVRRVPVTTGASDAEKIEIKDGLQESQPVVIDHPSRFVSDTEVELKD